MVSQPEAAGHIVDAHYVEVAAGGKGLQVAVQQDDGNPSVPEQARQMTVGFVLYGHQLVWREENATDFAFNEPSADFLRVSQTGIQILGGRVEPPQSRL